MLLFSDLLFENFDRTIYCIVRNLLNQLFHLVFYFSNKFTFFFTGHFLFLGCGGCAKVGEEAHHRVELGHRCSLILFQFSLFFLLAALFGGWYVLN